MNKTEAIKILQTESLELLKITPSLHFLRVKIRQS